MNTDEREALISRIDALAVRVRQLERAGMPAATTHSARVRRTTNPSINNATVTSVPWQSAIYDTGDTNWSAGSPTRLTAQRDGVYLITLNFEWTANVNGRRYTEIRLNGSTIIATCENDIEPSAGRSRINMCTVWEMSASDYVEARVYQNTGGALNINVANMEAHFTITRLP